MGWGSFTLFLKLCFKTCVQQVKIKIIVFYRLAAAKLLGHLFARQNEYDILSDSTIGQLEDWVVFYSLDLIEENFEHPDPYFFYLMLIWPCLDEDKQTEVSHKMVFLIFKKCQA